MKAETHIGRGRRRERTPSRSKGTGSLLCLSCMQIREKEIAGRKTLLAEVYRARGDGRHNFVVEVVLTVCLEASELGVGLISIKGRSIPVADPFVGRLTDRILPLRLNQLRRSSQMDSKSSLSSLQPSTENSHWSNATPPPGVLQANNRLATG
jgi:hypothetical protein